LAVSSAKRSPALPDVPALAESVPGYRGTLWIGLFAPAGVPNDVLSKLQSGMTQALASKDVRDKLELQGVELAAPTTPEQFSVLLQDDMVMWARIVKSSGASID
jgi:tripartite-type tricarboxylate transporter receptor subunit TctC